VVEQQASLTALLQSLGPASFGEIAATMVQRGEVEPEEELSPKAVTRLPECLASTQLPIQMSAPLLIRQRLAHADAGGLERRPQA
jgi:hypothetical protein